MKEYNCYLQSKIEVKELKKALSLTFNLNIDKISHLFDESDDFSIRYNITHLSIEKKGFFCELNIYVIDSIKSVKIYNNLTFGKSFVNYLRNDVLINDESDDPFQWILINYEGKIFLVEEFDNDDNYILVKSDFKELSLEKSLKLLPDNRLPINTKEAYFVKDSILWLKAAQSPR